MTFLSKPHIKIEKNDIPTLYLDTCIMLELAKYNQGKCTDVHIQEIGDLLNLLSQLMKAEKLLCPLGNQLQEMGMSQGRKDAKEFLLHFTNAWLKSPDEVKENELVIGYQSFITQKPWIGLNETLIFDKDPTPDAQFRIHLAPVYKQETLKKRKATKMGIVNNLNAAKQARRIEKDWDTQLSSELLADYQLAYHAFVHHDGFTPTIEHVLNEIELAYRRTGLCRHAKAHISHEAADSYIRFLHSSYHHNLPFQRIEAVLWAHLMQRSNKIVRGDRLDVLWAAAYLPYVDFAVTDNAFCTLLTESGLTELYGVKVYSMRSLRDIIDALHTLAAKNGKDIS